MKLSRFVNRLSEYLELHPDLEVEFRFDEGIGKPKHDLPVYSISVTHSTAEKKTLTINLYEDDPR